MQIICIPRGGTGKVRTVSVSPFLIKSLLMLVILCIASIPLLETRLLSVQGSLGNFEREERALRAEIMTLSYVRTALAGMEEKERTLRGHFGIGPHTNLESLSGIGGEASPAVFEGDPAVLTSSNPYRGMARRTESLAAVQKVLSRLTERQGEKWEGTPSIAPVALDKIRVSSEFGLRTNPFTNKTEFHAGVDILGPKGTKIIAPASGEVIAKGHDPWLGHHVVLQHPGGIKTVYGHLDTVSVGERDRVKRGDGLGTMGNSGLSTSPHLHYVVVVGERAVDPLQFILDLRPRG
jgi:murein DD-endopeptidase MepM/ murein hydrolase activator NlpD